MNQTANTQEQQLDTFADMTPIQPNVQQATDMNSQTENSGIDTFDNMEPIIPDSIKETKQEKENGEEQEQAEETKDTKTQEVKRQTDSLDDQTDEKPEGREAEAKGEDRPAEEEEQDRQETTGTDLEGKTIRLKVGDEKVDINENATVPVKVKGRKEFVTLNELRENFSGKKAWGDELNKVKAKEVEILQDKEVWEGQREQVKQHFVQMGEKIQRIFDDAEYDPLEPLKELVVMSGNSVLDFEKKIMEHFGNVYEQFSGLDETEQKLYWTERENQILRDNQTTRTKEIEERKASEQRNTRLTEARAQYGVSEQDFQIAEDTIRELGYDMNQVTPEQVSHYAALTPLVAQAEELASSFEDDLSSDEMEKLIAGTADTMLKFPELDPTESLKLSAKRMGYTVYSDDDLVNELKEKTKQPTSRLQNRNNPKKYAARDEGHIESFDDFTEEFYRR